ncbi:MAG TPA: PCRF domain-containing protein, partial [bacterium]|nr:PCRF domain-containing protein [bacterium]
MEEETLKQEIKEIEDKIEKTREILKNPDDQDLFDLAKEDLESLIKKKEELENETKQETQYSNKAVIIEIRAGVGGEEASLFAGDLFRMY